jgi:hypothetical protein
MADSNVSISFGADASGFLDGVARVSAALQTLPSSVNQVSLKIGDASRLSLAAINSEIGAEQAAAAEKKSLYDELTKLKIISAGERLVAEQTALDDEYAAEKALFEKRSQIDGLTVEQRRAALDQMLALDAKYARDSEKLLWQTVEKMTAPMDRMVDSMTSSFSNGVSGMIFGTRTLNQALLATSQAIVSRFIHMGVEIVADWGKKQLALAALSAAGEAQKTAAAASGAAARGGIAAGEAAAGEASILSSVLKSVTASASETFAGVFGFLAPVMGPAAAGPAAAAQSAVLSVAAFDIGAWQIDQDQIAMVHRNEMVMPAAEAGAFRSLLSNAASGGSQAAPGGGDTHVHLNVSALDSGSVKSWLSNNSRQIMKALDQAVKNGDHLGLRRLATT